MPETEPFPADAQRIIDKARDSTTGLATGLFELEKHNLLGNGVRLAIYDATAAYFAHCALLDAIDEHASSGGLVAASNLISAQGRIQAITETQRTRSQTDTAYLSTSICLVDLQRDWEWSMRFVLREHLNDLLHRVISNHITLQTPGVYNPFAMFQDIATTHHLRRAKNPSV